MPQQFGLLFMAASVSDVLDQMLFRSRSQPYYMLRLHVMLLSMNDAKTASNDMHKLASHICNLSPSTLQRY